MKLTEQLNDLLESDSDKGVSNPEAEFKKIFERMANMFKVYYQKNKKPDQQANQSGDGLISLMKGETVHGGHYGITRMASMGIKFGKGNSSKISEFEKQLNKLFSKYQKKFGGDTENHIRLYPKGTEDKYKTSYSITKAKVIGSAWSAVYLSFKTPSGSNLVLKK